MDYTTNIDFCSARIIISKSYLQLNSDKKTTKESKLFLLRACKELIY